ncbi:MAG: HNH endonuclease [Ilumatobacter sp.]|uniref:HNH endonuclease n=1 Tax=Ilumatobacter sp. TaxID=1967498 RepID=UPI00391A9F87
MPVASCQVDHSTEWHQGGTTDRDNAAIQCRAHNTDKHRHRRRTERATNGRISTFSPNGTIMLPVGCRPPRFDHPDDPDDPDDLDSLPDAEHFLVEAARYRVAVLANR